MKRTASREQISSSDLDIKPPSHLNIKPILNSTASKVPIEDTVSNSNSILNYLKANVEQDA